MWDPLNLSLVDCFARWRWRSCADDTNILNGGQLAVGTVFARELPLDNAANQSFTVWTEVDAWAKYRVDVPARLDNIFLTLNDRSGVAAPATSGNIIGVTPASTWRVAYVTNANWQDWDSPATNLRVVLSFQGTTNVANVGIVNVDVEWFAIRLRNEVPPH